MDDTHAEDAVEVGGGGGGRSVPERVLALVVVDERRMGKLTETLRLRNWSD